MTRVIIKLTSCIVMVVSELFLFYSDTELRFLTIVMSDSVKVTTVANVYINWCVIKTFAGWTKT